MAKSKTIEEISGNFKGKDIISLDQFTSKDIDILFKETAKMKDIAANAKPSDLLKGNLVTLLFYEPSSRTFGSFAAGIKQLGGQTIEIRNPQQVTSEVKGETFEDTIRVFEAYCDAIVIRHYEMGRPMKAAQAAKFIPIINAGDGVGEHPTQALFDLYTIYEKHKKLNNLIGVICGDFLYGRALHSLIKGLALYKGNTLYLLSPKELVLSREDFNEYQKRGIKLIEIDDEKDIPKNAHFWYWTRIQKERFKSQNEYKKVNEGFINRFTVTKNLLKRYGNKDMILMHVLPRIGEILPEVDNDPRAVYLGSEIRNGMYLRMALIALVLGKI